MTARRIWPALLVAGIALMIPFEATIARILGVACLAGFVVLGVFLVATHDFLGDDAPSESSASSER
jgi:hypothetical protein